MERGVIYGVRTWDAPSSFLFGIPAYAGLIGFGRRGQSTPGGRRPTVRFVIIRVIPMPVVCLRGRGESFQKEVGHYLLWEAIIDSIHRVQGMPV